MFAEVLAALVDQEINRSPGAPHRLAAEVERELRRAEIQASLTGKTFRPKHGGGKTLAELEAAEKDAEARAFEAAGITKRIVYESELIRLPFSVREQLHADVARGTAEIRPGARPAEETK